MVKKEAEEEGHLHSVTRKLECLGCEGSGQEAERKRIRVGIGVARDHHHYGAGLSTGDCAGQSQWAREAVTRAKTKMNSVSRSINKWEEDEGLEAGGFPLIAVAEERIRLQMGEREPALDDEVSWLARSRSSFLVGAWLQATPGLGSSRRRWNFNDVLHHTARHAHSLGKTRSMATERMPMHTNGHE